MLLSHRAQLMSLAVDERALVGIPPVRLVSTPTVTPSKIVAKQALLKKSQGFIIAPSLVLLVLASQDRLVPLGIIAPIFY